MPVTLTSICFIGCCFCAVVACYALVRFTRCLDRCRRYISIAVSRLNKRVEQLHNINSPQQTDTVTE